MQGSSFPKISVITPSFNQASYLEKTIASVLRQNYPNLEFIIIDGGSSDESVEIISKYSERIAYSISEKDKGQSDALNKGFARCTGDIIYWINSDDYLEENILHKVADLFEGQKLDMLIGEVTLINTKQEVLEKQNTSEFSKQNLFKYWKPYFLPCQPGIFFRRELLKRKYLVDETLHYGMDHELWLHLFCNNKQVKVGLVNWNVAYYLFHDKSKSQNSESFRAFMPEWKANVKRYSACLQIWEKVELRGQYLYYLARNYWAKLKSNLLY